MEIVKEIICAVLNFIFPISCVSCKKEGKYLCDECFDKIVALNMGVFKKPENKFFDGIFYVCDFERNSPLIKLVELLKYKSSQEIAEILAKILHLTFLKFFKECENSGGWTINFTPIHKKRFLSRGFNQSRLIAKFVSDISGIPICEYLIKIKNTKPQVGLKKIERINNLKDAFDFNKNFSGKISKNIILIDDVSTTGATLDECARVLKKYGAQKVYGMVICLVL